MHMLVLRLINQKDGLTKLATNSINVQTRNINKVIKRQRDACTNIYLPEDAELQLRVVFKQFCEKKHIKGSEIDVVHINKIRQVCACYHFFVDVGWLFRKHVCHQPCGDTVIFAKCCVKTVSFICDLLQMFRSAGDNLSDRGVY